MRKTKIVCTIGPASSDEAVLRELIKNGMNVARLNFSHGTYDNFKLLINRIKKIRRDMGVPVAILLDTKGPEIRLRNFRDGECEIRSGDLFTLTGRDVEGCEKEVSVTVPSLASSLSAGDTVLIDDGKVKLTVENTEGQDVVCRVVTGGTVKNHKGVNVPNVHIDMPFISDADREDLLFGIREDVDFVAASFVSRRSDVDELRAFLRKNGGESIRIISKIENAAGVANFDEILEASDGIMVARGDMGVEIAFENLPHIQKVLIEKGYRAGKQVITATQMLDSMIKNPRPTRAETTDVANAIYDGTSAIMLSGETAAGLDPIEAVRTMAQIAETTEKDINYAKRFRARLETENDNVTNAISHATVTTAMDLNAKAILTVTKPGSTAKFLSKYRPNRPILSCTPSEKTWRQLNLSWGVVPLKANEQSDTETLFAHAVDCAVKKGYLDTGDLVVITAGVPLGISGTTNLMKVHVVGNVLVKGTGIGEKEITAPICIARSAEEARDKFVRGEILVMEETSNDIMQILRSAGGIIVEKGDETCHAAVVGLSLDIPVIVGAANAVKILKSGTTVHLDAKKGIVTAN